MLSRSSVSILFYTQHPSFGIMALQMHSDSTDTSTLAYPPALTRMTVNEGFRYLIQDNEVAGGVLVEEIEAKEKLIKSLESLVLVVHTQKPFPWSWGGILSPDQIMFVAGVQIQVIASTSTKMIPKYK